MPRGTTEPDDGSGRRGRPHLTVVYTGEPDEVFDFPHDGASWTFGRDDEACGIVIWSAINGVRLARVAGVVFRMDDELWVRNLAESHSLQLLVPGRPPEAELPPRRSAADRGPARSIPGPLCSIVGPDGCELVVRQDRDDTKAPEHVAPVRLSRSAVPTRSAVPEVPDHLRALAVAVCAPLLSGGRLPATYQEVADTLDLRSVRTARRLVDELCEHYDNPDAGTGGAGFTLPGYHEVARLLVLHHRVTVEDLDLLPIGDRR